MLISFSKKARQKTQAGHSTSWKLKRMDIFPVPPTLPQALAIGFALTTARISIQIPHHVFNLIEMMPVADFPGKFGWGYDGVNLFAPTHLYGAPDDLRSFIDRAHSLGLGVILDVVYNHFGPDGNYLGAFSDDYLTRENENEWGDAVNFDGPNSAPVREFFITNGRYWIEEFHFDGFRFDALHAVRDRSSEYIIGEVGRAARKEGSPRSIIL